MQILVLWNKTHVAPQKSSLVRENKQLQNKEALAGNNRRPKEKKNPAPPCLPQRATGKPARKTKHTRFSTARIPPTNIPFPSPTRFKPQSTPRSGTRAAPASPPSLQYQPGYYRPLPAPPVTHRHTPQPREYVRGGQRALYLPPPAEA